MQTNLSDTAKTNVEMSFASMIVASKHIQALTNELVDLSVESLQHSTDTIRNLRSARTWEDVVRIETDYVREAVEKLTNRTAKMFEIATAIPKEVASRTQSALDATSAQAERAQEAAIGAVNAAADNAAEIAEQARRAH